MHLYLKYTFLANTVYSRMKLTEKNLVVQQNVKMFMKELIPDMYVSNKFEKQKNASGRIYVKIV